MYAAAATKKTMTAASSSLTRRSVDIGVRLFTTAGPWCPSLDDEAGVLPDRAAVEFLAAQLRVAVVRIDDEQRPLVAHRHVFAIALERVVPGEILDRDLARIVVERHRHDLLPARFDLLH